MDQPCRTHVKCAVILNIYMIHKKWLLQIDTNTGEKRHERHKQLKEIWKKCIFADGNTIHFTNMWIEIYHKQYLYQSEAIN